MTKHVIESHSSDTPKAGSVVLQSGRAAPGHDGMLDRNQQHGDIFFKTGGGETIIQICGDGRVIVRGEEVAENRAVYVALRDWLIDAGTLRVS